MCCILQHPYPAPRHCACLLTLLSLCMIHAWHETCRGYGRGEGAPWWGVGESRVSCRPAQFFTQNPTAISPILQMGLTSGAIKVTI